MTNERNRNRLTQRASATQPARLPGLPTVDTGNPALNRLLEAMRERLEVREGERGNPYEQVVTRRDLVDMGLTFNTGRARSGFPAPAQGGVPVIGPNGSWVVQSSDSFVQSILRSPAFLHLTRRLDDVSRFDQFPARVRDILRADLAQVDGTIRADIRRLEEKIAGDTQSLAFEVTEITAAVRNAAAGVRRVAYASANENRATAGQVTTITARLDDFGSFGASVEETMTATADRVTGLAAHYGVVVQAGNKVAGISLAASEDPSGESESAFIVLADKFAIVTGSTVITDPLNPPAANMPFGADASGVWVNGELRINASGTTLNDLAATTGVNLLYTSEFWKVDMNGDPVNTEVTFTVSLSGGLTGFVTWTKSGTGTAPPTAGTTNTWTVYAADQTDDAVTYTASLTVDSVEYTDSVTLVRLRDGSASLSGILTNETFTVASLADGTGVNYSGASGVMNVYLGTALLATPDVSFALAPSGNPNSLTYNINATTGAYSVTGGMTAIDQASLTIRATVGTATVDKTFTITKAKQGVEGDAGAAAQTLALKSTGLVFNFEAADSTSSASPTITFTANLQNVAGTATWTATAFNASGTSLGSITLGGSLNTRTLTAAQFVSLGATSTRYVKVTATLGSLSDTMTIYRTDGGSDAITAILSNEAHTLPASSTGTVSSFTGASTTISVFQGGTDVTSLWSFSRSSSAGMTTTLSGNGTPTVTVACTALSVDVGTCTITATRAGFDSLVKVFTVTKSKAGVDGGDGTDGSRGSLIGYGTTYGIRVSTWDSTSDQYANRVIDNMVNGTTTSTPLASTASNRIGDTVTLGNGSPWLETKGTYSAATTYYFNQLVVNTAGTKVYRALQTTLGNAVTNTTYFAEYATVNSRGAWVLSRAYAALDTVTGLNIAGVSTIWVANYAHTSQGTFATERDGGGFVQERFWSGSSWLRAGVIVDGNMLVRGSVAAEAMAVINLSAISSNLGTITAGSITGTAGMNITGRVVLNGDYTSDGTPGSSGPIAPTFSLDVNPALNADWGISAQGTSFGVVGSGGTTGTGLRGNGGTTAGVGVEGQAGGNHAFSIGVRGYTTGALSTGVRAENSAGEVALDVQGKFKWGPYGGTQYTWAGPDGTSTKVLGANANWLDVGPGLKVISGPHATAGASLGYLTLARNDGSGGQVKVQVFAV